MKSSAGESSGVGAAVIGAFALAICCGGPLLFAALAMTGTGTVLAALGWSLLGVAIGLAGLAAGAWWWLRRRSPSGPRRASEETRHG